MDIFYPHTYLDGIEELAHNLLLLGEALSLPRALFEEPGNLVIRGVVDKLIGSHFKALQREAALEWRESALEWRESALKWREAALE